jgi:hypothetical protein
MSSQVTRRAVVALVVGLIGCVPSWVKDELERAKQNAQVMQRTIADLRDQLQTQGAQIEIIERESFNKEYCRSGKNNEFNTRISQFIREVEKGVPGTCAQGPMEDALHFIGTQAYANQYFRPNENISAIRTARTGYLLKFLDPNFFHPSTRLLILVQPEDETPPAHRRALQLGEEFRNLIKQLAPGRELRMLEPHLLPCRLRKEVERRFQGPMDATLKGEPAEGTPRIRIWVFRTDCA